MSRYRYLKLENPARGGRFRWRDRILCSSGLALGVFFLILSWGFIVPVEQIVKQRIVGTLPDRLQVAKRSVSMGPVAFGGQIEQTLIDKVGTLAQVDAVFRQAHFPDPCQLRASYAGESLVTDLVLEMVDEGQVAHEIAPGYRFVDPGPGQPVPAVMPRSILDLVNAGISVNTELPSITESALLGHGFDLYLGTSSFRPGPATRVRCVLVGVSDQIGAGGPAIPFEVGRRLAQRKPIVHSLSLALNDPASVGQVTADVKELGLVTPRQDMATKVTSVARLLKFLGSLLPLAILSVTAVALGAVLELQVTRERPIIALYRALGATRKQVLLLYLARAASVAVLAFLLGVVGAWLVGLGLSRFLLQQIPPDMLGGVALFAPPIWAHLLALLFCFGLTMVAGWFPASKAASCDPATVFREPG